MFDCGPREQHDFINNVFWCINKKECGYVNKAVTLGGVLLTISLNPFFFFFHIPQDSDDNDEEDEMTMKKLIGEKTEGNKSKV